MPIVSFIPETWLKPVLETLALSSIYMAGMFWVYRTHRAFYVAEIAV